MEQWGFVSFLLWADRLYIAFSDAAAAVADFINHARSVVNRMQSRGGGGGVDDISRQDVGRARASKVAPALSVCYQVSVEIRWVYS